MTGTAIQFVGPFILFCLMFIVGLELTAADFRRVAAAPRAVVGGTLGQLLLLPLMTWALVRWLDLPPAFGARAVLVALAPGAGMSNLMAALARANVALSVTLTGIASVLSVVTLPVIASITMRVFLGESSDIEVPVAPLIQQLSLAMLLPIGTGMTIRMRFPEFADRNARKLQRLAGAMIAALIVGAIAGSESEDFQLEGAETLLVAAGLWTLAAMGIGWLVSLALRLGPAERATFLIEFSARNIAVSTIVALSGLQRFDLTIFSAVYGTVGYAMCGVAALLLRRQLGAAANSQDRA